MKIALVIHRFGKNINGGAETYCRDIALRLKVYHDIEIITTTAEDYMTWENHFPEGIEDYQDVTIRRFDVDDPRNIKKFDAYTAKVLNNDNRTKEDEEKWVKMQGPYSSKLFNYLKNNHDKYDLIIFNTFLYATSVFGIRQVPQEKSIMIPMTHDEPWLKFRVYKELFEYTDKIMYLTEEEKSFVEKTFPSVTKDNEVVGVGIDIPEEIDETVFKGKYNLRDYVLYAGRIDPSKGCDRLFDYFIKYKEEQPSDLKLVLMGKAMMDIPSLKDIVNLGFVSEEDKFAGMKGAKAFILPSKYESLSISTLESLAVGTPVIVNAESEVLKGHCIRSNAGFYYYDYYEFHECLDYLLTQKDKVCKLRENAVAYGRNYTWSRCIGKIDRLVGQS